MSQILEYALDTAVAFVALLLLTRLLGRKEISQITFFDFVSAITLGSLAAATLVTTELHYTIGLTTLAVWGLCIYLSNILSLKSIPARKLLEGEPVMVVYNGKILEKNLGTTYYNINDLLEELRGKDVFDPNEVELAVIEANGDLSVLKKPTTSSPVISSTSGRFLAKELVIDGKILDKNLDQTGVTREWLMSQLSQQGITDVKDVVLATMTPAGTLYVDTHDDQAPHSQEP